MRTTQDVRVAEPERFAASVESALERVQAIFKRSGDGEDE
jgi:hypothetical protein